MRIRLLGHPPLDTRARVCLLRGKAPGDPPMCGALSTCSYFTLGERWAPLRALSHNMLAQHTSQFLFQKSRTPRGAVRGQGSRAACGPQAQTAFGSHAVESRGRQPVRQDRGLRPPPPSWGHCLVLLQRGST